ncbi:hypothetical protein [Reinekea marinisedimentorum]|uniref:hypothetical protein n=1 Tax=Reinekea marinisedimentorum TaxID=230495 RepID=UPI0010437B03|nr:hypothetical protein [Reinekea marinisedimentorum]
MSFIVAASTPAELNAEPYVSADYFIYSEPVSVSTALNELLGDFSAGERAYFYRWYEVGIVFDNRWGFGYVDRRDYSLRFSRDAAELVGTVVNGDELETGREYDITLESYGVDSEGMRFFVRPDLKPWLNMEVGLSLLKSYSLLDGSVSGTASAVASDEYEYSLAVDYYYTDDILFERSVEDVTGFGATLDIALSAQLNANWRWDVRVHDLLGALYWEDVPNTLAEAYSDRVTVTEAGYAEWDPAVSGVETNEDYVQWLERRINSELYCRYGRLRCGIGAQYWVDDLLTRAGIGYQFKKLNFFGWYWRESSAVELAVSWPVLSVSAGVDNINPEEVKAAFVAVMLNY